MTARWKKTGVVALSAVGCATAAGLLIGDAWADGIPGGSRPTMYYAGFLEDDAGPVDGSPVVRVSLWTAAEPGTGTELCATPSSPVPVTQGNFRVGLPSSCVRAIQENANVWTEVQIGTDLPLPRQHLGAVPYAVEAGNGVPPGTIAPFGGETPPAGWAICDGSIVSGAPGSPYHRLYRAVGEAWGDGGDGTGTMFHLPELRGQFLRGAHGPTTIDPDGAVRDVGTLQSDALGSHAHPAHDRGHRHTGFHATAGTVTSPGYGPGTSGSLWDMAYGNNYSSGTATADVVVDAHGGPETRPTNVAVLYIIKL